MNLFSNIDKNLLAKFKRYHLDNPEVFSLFARFANQLYQAGNRKGSGWLIINRIRWEYYVEKNEVFKINNDYIALYARLLVYYDPKFKDFFEFRKMKTHDRRDSSEERYRSRVGGHSIPIVFE